MRGEAVGSDGGAAGGGGRRGGGACSVGVRDAEDVAAVLSAPPGAPRRARSRSLGDGAGADVCGGRRRRDRPGMVAVVQTAGDLAKWHPHVHAIVSRGGWTRHGEWIPVAFVDEHSAELLYRHKVICLLQDEGLLSDERTELLLSWPHTGFSWSRLLRSLRQALPLRIGADCHPRFAAKTSSLDSSLARSSPHHAGGSGRGRGHGGRRGGRLPYGHPLVPAGLGGGWGKTGFGWSPRISGRWSVSPAISCGRRSGSSGSSGVGRVWCTIGRKEATTAAACRPATLPRPSIRPSLTPVSPCTSRSRGGTWCGTTGGTPNSPAAAPHGQRLAGTVSRLAMR